MSATHVGFARVLRQRAVLPIALVMLAAFGLGLWLLTRIATEQDRLTEAQSQSAARIALQVRSEVLERTLLDYAAWGEAYRNLHAAFDLNWAYVRSNVGATLYEGFSIDYVLVIDPADRIIYQVADGALSEEPGQNPFDRDLDGIIAEAREASADETVVVHSVYVAAGEPVLVAAAALSTGGDPSVTAIPGQPSILLFGDRLTATDLAGMARDPSLQDFRVVRELVDETQAPRLIVAGPQGASRSVLRWDPPHPGRQMMETVLPWFAVAAVAFTAFIALVLRDAIRAARRAEEASGRLSEAYQSAEHQALHDATTGLPNRLLLNRCLAHALRRPEQRIAVLFMDLDRFKPVNDALGHKAGDDVLLEVANRLRRCVREEDVVARVGGDEFVAVAIGLDNPEVERLAARLVRAVSEPFRHEAGDIHLGVSIGVAVAPEDADTADELVRRADIALYRAKAEGRGTFRFFSPEMNEQIMRRRSLEAELRQALKEGEFELYFQPRVDARSLAIVGAEALVRWRHPQRGVVSPGEFIPLAEDTGIIVALGEWVLRTACTAAARWPDIRVSVNVSPVQFRTDDLVATVRRLLEETNLLPERLELEITEGVLLENTDRAQEVLRNLKALGVHLSMDDFGTGHSSLGYLKSFPFDGIKIDRQFISGLTGLTGREDSRAIVQAIIGLGRSLGLSVTAEGVETVEQLMLLRSDRCEEVQGYLLSPPRPEAEFELLLESGVQPASRVRIA